tara:strand:- start:6475 stop:8415 length:1941 start_codon:yes stop_codon:yes gene_type:complete
MASQQDLNRQKELNKFTQEYLNLLREEGNAFASIGGIISDNLSELGKTNDARKAALASARKLGSISDKLMANEETSAELSAKELEKLASRADVELQILKEKQKQAKLSQEDALSLKDAVKQSEALVKLAKERAGQQKEIEGAGGATLNFLKGVDGLLKKSGFGSLSEKLDFKGAVRDATVFNVKTKKASVSNVALTKNLLGSVKGLLGPAEAFLFVATQVGKGLAMADKNAAELRRSFGATTKEAVQLNNQFNKTAINSGDITANVNSLITANSSINDQLGIQVRYNDDLLVTTNALVKRQGQSVESAAGFAELVLATGEGADALESKQSKVVAEIQNATGVQMNFNKILEVANKTSGLLRVNLGKNPEEIAKAVAQVQALGIGLQEAASISGKLLDFQSSIEAELEAEVLTGKELNLEQARYLALQGKSSEAAAELLNQVGSLAEFQNMNVIQQRALASAAGLTADQLADQLVKQSAINSQKQDGLDIDGEQQKEAASALSIQQKLASAVEKLNSVLSATAVIVTGILGAVAGFFVGGVPGAILGFMAGAGVGVGIQSVADGTAPSSKGPFTITDSYGATAVTAAGDNVVVSPNVNSGGGSGITKFQANEMISLLRQVANKNFSVSMDGRKLSSAMETSGASYSV